MQDGAYKCDVSAIPAPRRPEEINWVMTRWRGLRIHFQCVAIGLNRIEELSRDDPTDSDDNDGKNDEIHQLAGKIFDIWVSHVSKGIVHVHFVGGTCPLMNFMGGTCPFMIFLGDWCTIHLPVQLLDDWCPRENSLLSNTFSFQHSMSAITEKLSSDDVDTKIRGFKAARYRGQWDWVQWDSPEQVSPLGGERTTVPMLQPLTLQGPDFSLFCCVLNSLFSQRWPLV